MQFQQFINSRLQELNPVVVGEADTPANKQCGPFAPDYVLIHQVLKGCGTLHSRGHVYPVEAGEGFIVLPSETASWVSDSSDPWSYRWIGFTGSLSSHFSALPPVFSAPENMFCHIKDIRTPGSDLPYLLASDLFFLYGVLLKSNNHKPDYVQAVVNYVQEFYMKKISIQAIADHIGLNRDYLSKQFKKKRGQSIQDYITDVRIRESKQHMLQGRSVKEAAALCGFNDSANFYKIFKKKWGISPQEWKMHGLPISND